MGIESPVHLLFLAVVVLVVLGPKRLPGLARAVGQGIREFRGALEDAQAGEPEQPPPPPGQQVLEPPPADSLHPPDQGAAPDVPR